MDGWLGHVTSQLTWIITKTVPLRSSLLGDVAIVVISLLFFLFPRGSPSYQARMWGRLEKGIMIFCYGLLLVFLITLSFGTSSFVWSDKKKFVFILCRKTKIRYLIYLQHNDGKNLQTKKSLWCVWRISQDGSITFPNPTYDVKWLRYIAYTTVEK